MNLRHALVLVAFVFIATCNPIANLFLSRSGREADIAAMLTIRPGTSTSELLAKHGPPRAKSPVPTAPGELWEYDVGPWWSYVHWETVVYRVESDVVRGVHIED